MANKICMFCKKKYGTISGNIDSHGVCNDKKCKEKAKNL